MFYYKIDVLDVIYDKFNIDIPIYMKIDKNG